MSSTKPAVDSGTYIADQASYHDTPAILRDPVGNRDLGLVVRTLEQINQLSIAGEKAVSQRVPVVSLDFAYSVGNTELNTNTLDGNSYGSVTQANALAVLATGANATGFAQLESVAAVRYIGGQGIVASFSGLWSAPAANSQSEVGLFDGVNNGYGFGYNGTVFGIWLLSNGVYTFVAQSAWNMDTMLSLPGQPTTGAGPSGFVFNPRVGNVFRLQFLWHGFGPIQFFISDGVHFQLCHRTMWGNANAVPSCLNPTLPFHCRVVNTTNATNLTFSTASAGVFIEGYDGSGALPFLGVIGCTNAALTSAVTTTETALFTLKNPLTNVYSGTNNNKVRMKITGIRMAATSSAAIARFRLVKNATLGGTPSYASISAATLVAQKDVAGTTVTGGTERFSHATYYDQVIDVTNQNIVVNPGETLTACVIGLAADSVNPSFMSLSWLELP